MPAWRSSSTRCAAGRRARSRPTRTARRSSRRSSTATRTRSSCCARGTRPASASLSATPRPDTHRPRRPEARRANTLPAVRAAILIVSSEVSSRLVPDEVGPLLASAVEEAGGEVAGMEVLPDDYALIEDRLHHFVEDEGELILTAGGVGPPPAQGTAGAPPPGLRRA